MASEIIYTSTQQGLKPGTYGFCTVAATAGMPPSLIEKLESLSGYRHLYTPGTPEAARNPVVYSHLLLKLSTRRVHVLSRIADAGLDYSQRSNKLAHHLALEINETVSAGPAWVLQQSDLFETTWSGASRALPPGKRIPTGTYAPRVCTHWKQATGDAGWGGVLAQQGLEGRRPAYVIVPEGLNMLPLFSEALALLPERKRWEVSFSTCFTKLPMGIDCLWRCVLAGSEEAAATQSGRGDLVLDLTKPLGHPPESAWVSYARSGEMPEELHASESPPSPGAAGKVVVRPLAVPEEALEGAAFSGEREMRVAPPTLPPAKPPSLRKAEKSNASGKPSWLLLLSSLVVACVGFASGVYSETKFQLYFQISGNDISMLPIRLRKEFKETYADIASKKRQNTTDEEDNAKEKQRLVELGKSNDTRARELDKIIKLAVDEEIQKVKDKWTGEKAKHDKIVEDLQVELKKREVANNELSKENQRLSKVDSENKTKKNHDVGLYVTKSISLDKIKQLALGATNEPLPLSEFASTIREITIVSKAGLKCKPNENDTWEIVNESMATTLGKISKENNRLLLEEVEPKQKQELYNAILDIKCEEPESALRIALVENFLKTEILIVKNTLKTNPLELALTNPEITATINDKGGTETVVLNKANKWKKLVYYTGSKAVCLQITCTQISGTHRWVLDAAIKVEGDNKLLEDLFVEISSYESAVSENITNNETLRNKNNQLRSIQNNNGNIGTIPKEIEALKKHIKTNEGKISGSPSYIKNDKERDILKRIVDNYKNGAAEDMPKIQFEIYDTEEIEGQAYKIPRFEKKSEEAD